MKGAEKARRRKMGREQKGQKAREAEETKGAAEKEGKRGGRNGRTMRQRNRKEMIKLIIFAILIMGALIIAISFSQVERKAKERFACQIAKDFGCMQIEVACNQLRKDTHRFYLREGMHNFHFKFSKSLNGNDTEENSFVEKMNNLCKHVF